MGHPETPQVRPAQTVCTVSHFPDVAISRFAPGCFRGCWCGFGPAGGAIVKPLSCRFPAFQSETIEFVIMESDLFV